MNEQSERFLREHADHLGEIVIIRIDGHAEIRVRCLTCPGECRVEFGR